jgi:flagellar biosynthesis protein FlhF
VQLVLSAVAKLADLDDAMERFRPLFAGNGRGTVPNALIFSKVDETTQPGAMASVAWRHPTPVSYLTTGQNVPGDLMVAEPLRLAEMVV